ncbi:MAG TPA: EAL domain-containing protein [Burkholderiaceae bacterium]|nr:EAL domain-containing protein [Burkholderiaceae bacterium]
MAAGVAISHPLRGVGSRVAASLLRRLSDLSVGKKLLLIYLLDLCTVLFISSILIREKYIAIDFSRKELSGTAYIEALRPTLVALGRSAPAPDTGAAVLARLAEAELQHGAGMGSAELHERFVRSLAPLGAAGPAPAPRQAALEQGKALVTRVGNQSNLILDPDLDSYYTMSLILLRYPTLLDAVAQITPRLHNVADGVAIAPAERTRLFVLEGELRSAGNGIGADYAEAVAAAQPLLRERLAPAQARLDAAIERFRAVVRDAAGGEPVERRQIDAAERDVLDALDNAWGRGTAELTRLIDIRVHDFFVRMWLHLGTAALLLAVILLAVFFVAGRISRPLRGLSQVVDTVRRTGDHALRSTWTSGDEIGRLVLGFNEMLAQLDHQRQVQQEMAASARAAEAQQRLLERMPVPLMVTSIPDHRVLHANPQARAWLGDTEADPWAKGISPELRRRFFQQLSDQGVVHEFEVHWQHGPHTAWAVLSACRLDYQGQDAVVTAFTPINSLKALEQRLELWAKVFEASSEGIVLLDARGRLLSANRAICKAGGFDPAEVVGQELDFVQVGELPAPQARQLWATADSRGWWRGEVSVRKREGGAFPAWAVLTAVRDASGTLSHYIFSCLDITDRKASEERVRYLADHDVLTGLPNRHVAEQRLREAMRQSTRTGQPVAVLFIDLDRFKTINDSLGHQVGDALLQQVAQRLRLSIREADTVSRFGGDEFVVLLNGVSGNTEAEQIAQRLLVALRAPYAIDAVELNVSCSVGIAMFPGDTLDMDELMRHADTAMYQAKASGRDSVHFFTHDLNERAQQKLQIELLLRNAVGRGELRLAFQPQVHALDGSLVAVEALLRWHTPELGEVAPAVFIPLAEESRLIVPVGEWVIDEACRQLADWRARGVEVGVLSVNLSAVQLLDPGLLPALRGSLARHGVPAAMLELELTESTLMDHTDERLARLHALKALGVKLSIDDFGTGYSSLSYLSRLPMDKLKIDRSLVKDILTEPKDRAISEAIIALAHRLKMTVVAEGVETAPVQAALAQAWCDAIQGYHTGRPMAPAALEAWLAACPVSAPGQLEA